MSNFNLSPLRGGAISLIPFEDYSFKNAVYARTIFNFNITSGSGSANLNAMLSSSNISKIIIRILFSSLFNQNLLSMTLVTCTIICIIIFGLYVATARSNIAKLKE